MKTLLFIILLSSGLIVQAQQTAKPIQGWWVIESNVHSPKKQTVKFYDTSQQLLYQENYNRKVLKCSNKRIRKMLDGVLTTVLINKSATENAVLANLIKHKP